MAFMSVLGIGAVLWVVIIAVVIAFVVGVILIAISLVCGCLYLADRKKIAAGIPKKKYKKWISIICGVIGLADFGILYLIIL